MDKSENIKDVDQILRGLGLTVKEFVVREVVDVLRRINDSSLYEVYEKRKLCGKGTAYKIKRLYASGKLGPYLEWLNSEGLGEAGSSEVNSLVDEGVLTDVGAVGQSDDLEPSVLSSAEWRYFRLNNHGVFARAIAAHAERMRLRAYIVGHDGSYAFRLPRLRYGPEEEAIIRAIRRRNRQLTSLEKQFAQAEADSDRDAAKRLAEEIHQELHKSNPL